MRKDSCFTPALVLIGLSTGISALGVKTRHNEPRASTSSLVTRGSTPLFYRDRHISEEQLTTTANSVAAQIQPHPISPPPQSKVSTFPNIFDESNISIPLVNGIWSNQVLILALTTAIVAGVSVFSGNPFPISSLHWNESPAFHSFFDFQPTLLRMFQGVLATVPVVALSYHVEQSDNRDASHVNFSTTNMVISLFGRRRTSSEPDATSTSMVMVLSLLIAVATGISEEVVFRGYIPTAIESLTQNLPLALLGSAGLFAMGHVSPKSTPGENKVVGGLQFANGLWYGMVYLLAGGDILPCIIAHTLSDMHVLCETWHAINNQMDYTQDAFHHLLDDEEEEAIDRIKEQAGPSLNAETLNFARRFFYAFDHEHKGSLSLSDVQRAVTYAFLKNTVVPEPHRVEGVFNRLLKSRSESSTAPEDRLNVSEFLRLLFALKSREGSKSQT